MTSSVESYLLPPGTHFVCQIVDEKAADDIGIVNQGVVRFGDQGAQRWVS
jgi:hypothetical protein